MDVIGYRVACCAGGRLILDSSIGREIRQRLLGVGKVIEWSAMKNLATVPDDGK